MRREPEILSPTRKERYDRILEILSGASFIWALYPLLYWDELADTAIPIHFDIRGTADGWGGRSYLLILPIVAAVLFTGLSISEKYYKKFNYPVKVSDHNRNTLYRLGVRMMRHIKLEITFMFACINNLSLFTAFHGHSATGSLAIHILIVCLPVTPLYFHHRMAGSRCD